MSAAISRNDVAHVARLANLELNDEELQTMTAQLAVVLEHACDLAALDLEDVLPTTHPIALRNVWRDDICGATLDRSEVLDVAPAVDRDRFEVPAILGDEP